MTLYYEDEEASIAAIRQHGLAVVLGSHAEIQLCDRSLLNEGPADEPEGTPIPEGFAELTFTLKDSDATPHEVFPADVPEGRYFRIPVSQLPRPS